MEPPGSRADQFGEPRLGRHMDIFERQIDGHAMRGVFGSDGIEPIGDGLRIRRRNNPLRAKHRDMRLGGTDVLFPQALVEGDRGVYLTHDGRRPLGEAATPHAIGI